MNRSNEEIQKLLSTLQKPGRADYSELNEYSRDERPSRESREN
jgi:hypothetical protein